MFCILFLCAVLCAELLVVDDRWLEWLDSKLALLVNRDGVDPRDYGGKAYEEYGFAHLVYLHDI